MAKKILNLKSYIKISTSWLSGQGTSLDECVINYYDPVEYLYTYDEDEYDKMIETINSNKYTLDIGHKFYIDKKASVPRIKLQDILFDNLIDLTSDVTKATHFFIQDPINHMIIIKNFYQVSKEQLVQFLNLCVTQKIIETHETEDLLDALGSYQDNDVIIVSRDLSTFINERTAILYKGVPLCKNILQQNQEIRKRIHENYVEEFLHIDNNLDKTYHYRELLPHMNGDETITIDEKVYNQLSNMFESVDKDNHVLAMEIMANCNYQKSIMYILILLREYNYKIGRLRSRTHVNFKSLLGYLGMKHDNLYVEAYEMIDIMLERNLITLEKLQYLFDKYQDDFIRTYGNHFKIHQITLSPELAEKLNVDYVKELTPRYKVKEVEEKEEEVKPEVSDEISWV